MQKEPFANEYLANVRPYKATSQEIWTMPPSEWGKALKLDWNEATIEPPPSVRQAVLNFVDSADFFHLYPATLNGELLGLLSLYAEVPKENIQYFPSSDSLHEYIARLYIGVGDKVLLLWPSYDNFRSTAESCGANIVYFEVGKDFAFDLDALQDAISRETPKIVYISNPNNPVGYSIPTDQVQKLLKDNPNTIFILDEAYAEFSHQTCNKLALSYDNILITHTLSKAFALANVRFGYLVSSVDHIDAINRIRNAKNVPTLTQVAAIAALKVPQYMWDYVQEVDLAKRWFMDKLQCPEMRKWIKVYPSSSNFVMVQCKDIETKSRIFYGLRDRKIYIRQLNQSARLLNCVRVTIGKRDQMKIVFAALCDSL